MESKKKKVGRRVEVYTVSREAEGSHRVSRRTGAIYTSTSTLQESDYSSLDS